MTTWSVVQTRWNGEKWVFMGHVFSTFFRARAVKRAKSLDFRHRQSWRPGDEHYQYRVEKTS